MTALDEHLMAPWEAGGTMSTGRIRATRRRKGLPNWRFVRYADDFAVLVNGSGRTPRRCANRSPRCSPRSDSGLSESKTRVVHLSEGFSFLGFRIQWRRKRGTSKWYVYTFIDDRPVRSVKAKIRALTRRTSQLDLGYVLTRLNQVMHGWANYFRHAVAKNAFTMLDNFAWRRVIRMLMETAPLEMEGRPPTVHHPHRAVAAGHGGRGRAAADRGDTGHPVPLPRHQDPQPLGG